MIEWICKTCGTQYPESHNPPEHCNICQDERQYTGWNGQQWTDMVTLQTDHHNEIRQLEPGLIGIGTQPEFAIGQRALLVQTLEGNLLWDCITMLDEDTRRAVCQLGGIRAIAISHPHYYSAMAVWAREFDAPVYLHSADRQWVMYPNAHLRFWQGENLPLFGGLTLVRCGGHFPGGTVAHWPAGAENRGVLLSGDIITVASDRHWVSFMYSYPNLIPLPAMAVRHIVNAVEPYPYERIYGAWWGRVVENEARQAVRRSARRYIAALNGDIKSTLQAIVIDEI